jgi:hypothetical protein
VTRNRNGIGSRPRGSFADLETLFEHLSSQPVIELGKPLPEKKFIPRPVGRCPAAHNVALLGEEFRDRRRRRAAPRNAVINKSSENGDHDGAPAT